MTSAPPSRFPPLLLLLPLLLIFGGILGTGWYFVSAINVTLYVDGQAILARTHQSTVADFLNEAGVWLETADTVTPGRADLIREGLTIHVQHARLVVIDVDHIPHRFFTNANSVPAILSEAKISLHEHDSVQLWPIASGTPADIVLNPSIMVQLVDDNQARTLYTSAPTVNEALAAAGVTLYTSDNISPPLNTFITAAMGPITIRRSQAVTIDVDGHTLATRTHGGTVKDVLDEAGMALVGWDRSAPDSNQPFTAGMTINVIRVTESDEIEQIALPFKTINQIDLTLGAGTQRIIQVGINGVQEIHRWVRRENGVEVSQSATLSWQIQPAQDQIVAVASTPASAGPLAGQASATPKEN